MQPLILKLDVTGTPNAWIPWTDAAVMYARGRVLWEAGQEIYTMRGGRSASGAVSELRINSIIATKEKRNRLLSQSAPANNLMLYRRDGFRCLYCAEKLPASRLSADHVQPRAQGGGWLWTNLASCCPAMPTSETARRSRPA